jgi:hypothetical protein
MNAQDICDALRRYPSESEDDRREIATKIGISWITLSAWLARASTATICDAETINGLMSISLISLLSCPV